MDPRGRLVVVVAVMNMRDVIAVAAGQGQQLYFSTSIRTLALFSILIYSIVVKNGSKLKTPSAIYRQVTGKACYTVQVGFLQDTDTHTEFSGVLCFMWRCGCRCSTIFREPGAGAALRVTSLFLGFGSSI